MVESVPRDPTDQPLSVIATPTHTIRIKRVGPSTWSPTDMDARDLEYLKRCGMKPEDVQRPPRSGDWHGFLPEEIPEGQCRVIVNLDTLEYLDPVKFGQAPTLSGMVTLAPQDRDLPIVKKASQDTCRCREPAPDWRGHQSRLYDQPVGR
jgi:hypothetical protein